MVITDKIHDPDSSRDTWEKSFQIIYKKKFGKFLDLLDLQDKETTVVKRWYVKINKDNYPELRLNNPKFKIAGDCDFNFNEKKIKYYKILLQGTESDLLEKCGKMHHSFYNFSFMPITGKMQLVKGSNKLDRLDRFIYLLSIYYEQTFDVDRINCEIVKYATRQNKPSLMMFLARFDSVFDYCKEIYFIDEPFVLRLIENGKQGIVGKRTAIQYMELALEYWEIRRACFKEYYDIIF